VLSAGTSRLEYIIILCYGFYYFNFLFKNMLWNNFCIFLDTDDDNNKNISLRENHSNIQPESIESKKNKPIKFNSKMLSAGTSRLKNITILGYCFYYFNIIVVLIGQLLGYENHENMNNSSQSKSMQLQIKSGHQVLSVITIWKLCQFFVFNIFFKF